MPLLDNIPRLRNPTPERFKLDYLHKQKPVVLTRLYEGQAISRVKTAADAARHFGGIKFLVNKNDFAYEARFSKVRSQRYVCSLTEYLELAASDPAFDLLCTEYPLAQKVRRLLRIPEIAKLGIGAPPRCLMYIASKGQFAPLHFDADLSQVLLTQVFGRKRAMLIPPRFHESFSSASIFSRIAVQDFSDQEKRRFLLEHGGFECVLEPGETLYIPRLWWHYLDNLETSMSFNVRFILSPFDLALRLLPSTHVLQKVASSLIAPDGKTLAEPRIYTDIIKAYFGDHRSRRERDSRYGEALTRAYRQLARSDQDPASSAPAGRPELARFKEYLQKNLVTPRELSMNLRVLRMPADTSRLSPLDLRILKGSLAIFLEGRARLRRSARLQSSA